MKIIRPEKTEIKKEELIDDNTYKEPIVINMPCVADLMQQTINENSIKVEIILTKKQFDLWVKRGAEKWLKRLLTKK